jgi:hypothetical protein
MAGLYAQGITPMQEMVTREDCVEAANPSLARRMRFRLLAQRGIGRKYGFTVDSLCGNPLCIRDEHVVYRPWKALTKPTKWGEYAKKLAALKVGKSFEIADYPHSQTEISKLRGGIGGNRSARLVRFAVCRLSGSIGVCITKIGTWESRNTGG